MTKSWEYPDKEFVDAAQRESVRTKVPVAEILKRELDKAKAGKDKRKTRKLVQALKFIHERNKAKRRRRRR
jgi:hypothetical protein